MPKPNHISKLTQELAETKAELSTLHEQLTELVSYLTSSKFHKDPTVQVRDVLTRLTEARSAGWDARSEQERLHAELNHSHNGGKFSGE